MSGEPHAHPRSGLSAGRTDPLQFVGRSAGCSVATGASNGQLLGRRARHRCVRLVPSRHARHLQHRERERFASSKLSLGAWGRKEHDPGGWNSRSDALRRRLFFVVLVDRTDARRPHQTRSDRSGVRHARRRRLQRIDEQLQRDHPNRNVVRVAGRRRGRRPGPPVLHGRLLSDGHCDRGEPDHSERRAAESDSHCRGTARAVRRPVDGTGGHEAGSFVRAGLRVPGPR